MNRQVFSVFNRVFNLIRKQDRILVWQPPILITLFSVIVLPCLLHHAFAEVGGNGHDFYKSGVLDGKTIHEDFKSVLLDVPEISKSSDIRREQIYKLSQDGIVNISPSHGKSDQCPNKGNEYGNKHWSVLYEYLFHYGFIGFLAWIVMFPCMFPSIFTHNTRRR